MLVQLIVLVAFVIVPLPEKVESVSVKPGTAAADALDALLVPAEFAAVTVNV